MRVRSLRLGCLALVGASLTMFACPRNKARRPESSAVRGTVDLHPQLRGWAKSSRGALEVRLVDVDDKRAIASKTIRAVELPARFAFSSTTGELTPAAIAALERRSFFVSARWMPEDRGRTPPRVFGGERWGRIGKPFPMSLGDPADVTLSFLDDGARTSTAARAARTSSTAEEPDNPVLVHGTIALDPRLPVEQGGFIHFRLVSLEIMRPFVFMRWENVHFPFEYTVRAKDKFYPLSLRLTAKNRFYVDATYDPPGLHAGYGLFEWHPPAVMGEAWGEGGAPEPLARGDRADVVLSRLWTEENLKGNLRNRDGARIEGWVWVAPWLREQVRPRNRLTVGVIDTDAKDAEAVKRRIFVAKVYENIDPAVPIAYHVFDADFLEHPIDRKWHGYFHARLESFDERGERVGKINGGRASEQTGITIFAHTLRIILDQGPKVDPFEGRPEIEGLKPSEITAD
jgi:hypothetical protein